MERAHLAISISQAAKLAVCDVEL